MSTPTRGQTTERFFDSAIERQGTLFDLVRNNNERSHRFSRSVIEGARQGNRDLLEVGRRWITNPTDIVAVYEAMSEAVSNSQSRFLALSREAIEDFVESQREGREALRQGLGDVREVVLRAQENGPQFLRRGALAGRGSNTGAGNGSKERAPVREK